MSLALIRFVNSLLDPLQRANKSLSLSMLAREAGLPTVFVEIRHWGTHERDLPGEEVLREMGVRAVEWLYREYWKKLDDGEDIWRRWKEGTVGVNEVVEGIRGGGRREMRGLIEELALAEDFEESKKVWEGMVTSCTARLPRFPEMVLDCMVEMLISIPQCNARKGHI
jgi:ribosomal biogenesis protein LAS1